MGSQITDIIQADTIRNKSGTGAPNFDFGMKFNGGKVFEAEEDSATSGTVTVTQSSGRKIVFTGVFSAGRNVVLPTTGIKKGETFHFVRSGSNNTFDLSFTCGGVALTAASSVYEPTIRKGFVVLRAKIDNPATNTDWTCEHVYEEGSDSLTVASGLTTTPAGTIWFRRNNATVIATIDTTSGTSSGVNTLTTSAIAPSRLRPSAALFATGPVISNSVRLAGVVAINTDGSFTFYKYDQSNFSGACWAPYSNFCYTII